MKYNSFWYFSIHNVEISLENTTSGNDWIPKYKPDWGRCYSYRAPKHISEAEINTITLILNATVEVYLHHPGQFCTWDIFVFAANAREQTYMDVSHEVISLFYTIDAIF